jgi:SAM-dependent methyltransferase
MESLMPAQPTLQEIDQEIATAREVVTRSVIPFLKSVELISESYLAQTLIALWDSGVYEYVRRQGRIEIETAAHELGLDAGILRVLIEYLVGRGLLNVDGEACLLSDKGRAYWNYVTRGALISHLAGYNALLTHLGPALRKEIDLSDPSLARSERLVAVGAGCTLLGSDMVPWILETIRELKGNCVLDLGCGSGIFLTHLIRQWADGRGIGIDRNREAVADARTRAQSCGFADRLEYFEALLSGEPMNLSREILDRVDLVTAIFIVHEFSGRGGDQALVSVFTSLRRQLPGRKLLLVEGSRADPYLRKAGPVRSHAQLDYSLIHPLSGQGRLKSCEEWQQLIEASGAKVQKIVPGFKLVPAWINLYIIEL